MIKDTQSVFAMTDVVIQIANQVQSQKYQAPVLVKGFNVVVDGNGKIVYDAANMERPMSSTDFDPEILQALNSQLNKLGLEVRKLPLEE